MLPGINIHNNNKIIINTKIYLSFFFYIFMIYNIRRDDQHTHEN